MIEDYLNQDGYRVNKGTWTLYNAASAATLTLTGALPTVSFRCSVRLYTATGKTDVAGTVVVGSETLTFTVAGKKTTSNLLTALPVVTTANLTCMIEILAIDSGGAPISLDTQTAIDCRFQDTQKAFQTALGEWSTSAAIAYTNDASCIIGKLFSYGGYDYQIAQVSAHGDLNGDEVFRKLWLTGKTLAPSGRSVVVDTEDITTVVNMIKAIYDTDDDGIVDKAEAVRDLDTLPITPTEGEIVTKDGKLYVAVTS